MKPWELLSSEHISTMDDLNNIVTQRVSDREAASYLGVVMLEDDAEDQELLRQIQGGRGAAFDRLAQKYRHRLPGMLPYSMYIALRKLNDGWAEVVQEFWVRVLKGAHTFELGRPVRPWLSVILQNTARRYLRARTRWYSRWFGGEREIVVLPVRDEAIGWDNDESRARLRAFYAELSDEDRLLLELFVAGVPHDEIAKRLDITPGACRVRLCRIRKKLRDLTGATDPTDQEE